MYVHIQLHVSKILIIKFAYKHFCTFPQSLDIINSQLTYEYQFVRSQFVFQQIVNLFSSGFDILMFIQMSKW